MAGGDCDSGPRRPVTALSLIDEADWSVDVEDREPDRDALAAERARLVARIAEIDVILA